MNYVSKENLDRIVQEMAKSVGTGNGLEDWQAEHEYKEKDICVYEGQIYRAKVGFTSDTTFNTIEILQEYTPIGGETIIPYEKDTEISIDDIVSYDNNTYKALYNFVCGEEFSLYALQEYVPQELTSEEVQEIIDSFEPEFVPEDEDNNTSDGIPLAAIIPWDSGSNIIPPGFLECNGQAVSRTEYADLFGAIGTKYGSGDGSTTFNVPDYTDGVFLEGSDTAGTEHAPGLPNIEGSADRGDVGFVGRIDQRLQHLDGAFSTGESLPYTVPNTAAAYPGYVLKFNASDSNPIYGNSTTVQPKSSTTRYLIKFIPSVPESEASAAASASVAQAAAQAAESYAGSAGIPVGTLFPYAADTQTPPTGFLFCNGQAVSRTMYADLFSVIGTTYGPGDGSTTFNLPTEEFLKGVNLGGTAPVIYGNTYDESRTYSGSSTLGKHVDFFFSPSNDITRLYKSDIEPFGSTDSLSNVASSVNSTSILPLYADLSSATPQYSSTVHYIIKAYNGVTPTSAGIDLSQYASDLSNKADRGLDNLTDAGKDRFLGDDNYCIIYPNGGSESSPANITINSRYVEANPFSGYDIAVRLEVYYNGVWGEQRFHWTANSTSIGASAYVHDGEIVIQTGVLYILTYPSSLYDSSFGLTSSSVGTSLPARVKVWKVGKVANNA